LEDADDVIGAEDGVIDEDIEDATVNEIRAEPYLS
jgi:hypothetical protein